MSESNESQPLSRSINKDYHTGSVTRQASSDGRTVGIESVKAIMAQQKAEKAAAVTPDRQKAPSKANSKRNSLDGPVSGSIPTAVAATRFNFESDAAPVSAPVGGNSATAGGGKARARRDSGVGNKNKHGGAGK